MARLDSGRRVGHAAPMTDDQTTPRRPGRPRVHADAEAAAVAARARAKAHLKAKRAALQEKHVHLTDGTVAKADALIRSRGLTSYSHLVTVLVDEATEGEHHA